MLMKIILTALNYLLENKRIILTEAGDIQTIATEILQKMPDAPFGSHFGSWLGKELIGHAMVEELFATDKELKNVLQDMDFYN